MGMTVSPTDNIKQVVEWGMYKKNLVAYCTDNNSYLIPLVQVPWFKPTMGIKNYTVVKNGVSVRSEALKYELLRQYYWGTTLLDQIPCSDTESVGNNQYIIKYAVPFIAIQSLKTGRTYTLYFKVRLGRKLDLSLISNKVLQYTRQKEIFILRQSKIRKEPFMCSEQLVIGLNDPKYGFVAKYHYVGLSDDKMGIVSMDYIYLAGKWLPQAYKQNKILGYSSDNDDGGEEYVRTRR